MASDAKHNDARAREREAVANAPKEGHLPVSELIADRPAAPSPFGDDQTFPLPVDQLTFKAAIPSQ